VGLESIVGLICVGVIAIAFVAAYIQHKLQRRTAEAIRNARGDDIARIRTLVEARDKDQISVAEFHQEITVIRNRQTQRMPMPQHGAIYHANAQRYGEFDEASLEDTSKRKRISNRPKLSNRMALIIAIFIVIVYLAISNSIGTSPGNQEAVSTRSLAVATSLPKHQSTTTVRRTQAPRVTTTPAARAEPESGVLYAFHSKDFSDYSEPESLPIAELGSFFLPPSTVRYELTRQTSGYALVSLLDISSGCLPHGGSDKVILPFGPDNPTVYLLSQGQGCRFNAEIEWIDSPWSFWISNDSVETASRADTHSSNQTAALQSDSNQGFSITQVATRFNVMVGGQVNLREGPGTQFAKVGSILGGNTLEVLGVAIGESIQGDSQWYLVRFLGEDAFIAKALTVRTN